MHVTVAPVLPRQLKAPDAGWRSSLADAAVADAWFLWIPQAATRLRSGANLAQRLHH